MTFTSLGKALDSIVVAVMRKFILLIPLIYLMPQFFPENRAMAVYLAEPAADFFAILFTSILCFWQGVDFFCSYAKKSFKSSSTVPIPAIPKFSTRTFATFGDKNAGSVGPR